MSQTTRRKAAAIAPKSDPVRHSPNDPVTVTFTRQEIGTLLTLLGDVAYKYARPIIVKIEEGLK